MADTLIGQTLGNSIIEEPLGSGGMATVYRARRQANGEIVAVKVILPNLANAAEFVARFRREARLMTSLDHPHILPVYDFGVQDGVIYLVMRLMKSSLSHKIVTGPLSLSSAAGFVEQIASALDYAHSKGIVHRDLKPANVLLDTSGTAYLTDFGIAKWTEETTGLTMTGMIIGTPGYMAPEQWRTEPVDPRTDVYALGVMLYEMLSGEMPFRAETPFSLMYRHLDEPPPAVTLINRRVPRAVDHVIRRAMAKIPSRRYPSAGALAVSLREIVQLQAGTDSDYVTAPDLRIVIDPGQTPASKGTYSGDAETMTVHLPEEEATYLLDEETALLAARELARERAAVRSEAPTLQEEEEATYLLTAEAALETMLETGRETYNSIDVGARTLLARAREAVRGGPDRGRDHLRGGFARTGQTPPRPGRRPVQGAGVLRYFR